MKKERSLRSKRTGVFPYLLMLPAMSMFVLFCFYPFFKTIYLTFFLTNVKGEAIKFMALDNYRRVLTGTAFANAVKNSFIFAAMVGIPSFFIGFILALAACEKYRTSKLIEVMFSLPMAVAGVAAAAIGRVVFSSSANGIMNYLLGTEISWLENTKTALLSVGVITVWLNIGSNFIFLLTGVRNVSVDLIECARIDGAGYFKRLFKIVIPLASPQIFFVVFLDIVSSFQAFGQIKILTGGGPNGATSTLIYEIFRSGLSNGRYETACVYSLILFLIIFLITRIQFLLEKKVVNY